MEANEIYGLMMIKKVTVKALAKELSYDKTNVNRVIRGEVHGLGSRGRSGPATKAHQCRVLLAEKLGLPFDELWPAKATEPAEETTQAA